MKVLKIFTVTLALLVAAASACSDESSCDPATLAVSLDRAQPGDTVEVGACRFEGTFVVPPGVTLQGAGRGETTLVTEGDGPALKLLSGSPIDGKRIWLLRYHRSSQNLLQKFSHNARCCDDCTAHCYYKLRSSTAPFTAQNHKRDKINGAMTSQKSARLSRQP